MMETVILKPGGVDGRQWLPTLVLAAIAVVASCEREGRRIDLRMAARAASLTALVLGSVLGLSLLISAAGGRLSGSDLATAGITALFALPLYGAVIQIHRAAARDRAWLGLAATAYVFLIVVTSEGTYAWSPHWDSGAFGREMFEL